MSDLQALERRIAVLEARQEIRDLQHMYGYHLDKCLMQAGLHESAHDTFPEDPLGPDEIVGDFDLFPAADTVPSTTRIRSPARSGTRPRGRRCDGRDRVRRRQGDRRCPVE